MIGEEARRNCHRAFEAQPKQTGSGQQDEGECDLGDDESVAQALGGVARRAAAGIGLQRVDPMAPEVEPGDRQGDHDPQDNRSEQRHQV